MTVPGLHYVPDWLDSAHQHRLAAEIDSAPWSTELRRRVQHYGHRYAYGRRSVSVEPATPLPAWATELAGRLHAEGHLDRPADQVIVNEYEPGQGISAHVDCVPCFGPAVAAISLGSACTMDFLGPAISVPVRLEPGGLCVMTGPARYEWKHAIAARRSDPSPSGPGRIPRGRRVSITFRTVLDQ